jgi:hypothetical protein
MALHGRLLDEQALRNLGVRLAPRYLEKHLTLPFAQPLELVATGRVRRAGGEVGDQPSCHLWCNQTLSAGDGAYRGQERRAAVRVSRLHPAVDGERHLVVGLLLCSG